MYGNTKLAYRPLYNGSRNSIEVGAYRNGINYAEHFVGDVLKPRTGTVEHPTLRVHSHRAKANAKAKIFLDV